MGGDLLERFRASNDRLESRSLEPDDQPADLGVCGLLYGVRDRALMLEFRKKTGDAIAVGYAWLEQAEYDPSVGITLRFVGCTIRIAGQHLGRPLRGEVDLFQGILRHRITWIQEAEAAAHLLAAAEQTLVTGIHFQPTT